MIDLHCHVLPGIDDGPPTLEGALGLARAAAAAGTKTLVATPHVNWRYRNDADGIAAEAERLREHFARDGIVTADGTPLELRCGAEVALTAVAELAVDELERVRLGGGPWLLVEPPFTPLAPNIDGILLALADAGHRIVLAHPERCPAFHRDRALVERLVAAGMLTSVTAGSLIGDFGKEARDFALWLAREGLLHNVASDAHDTLRRAPTTIGPALAAAHLTELGPWLTETVPAAILAGAAIPPRPAVATVSASAGSGDGANAAERRSRWRLRGR